MEEIDRQHLNEIGGQINTIYLNSTKTENHLFSISNDIEDMNKTLNGIHNVISENNYHEDRLNLRNITIYLQIITAIMLPIIGILLLIIVFKV